MTHDGFATILGEHVCGDVRTPVSLRLHRTFNRLEIRWAEDGHIETPRPSQFDVAVVSFRGAVDGTWVEGSAKIRDSIVVAGGAEVTRLAPIDLSRHLAIPTDLLHEALGASAIRHGTVALVPPTLLASGGSITIDSGIADLIQHIWTLDCETYSCCENQDGFVVIGFTDGYSAERFIAAVAAMVRPTNSDVPTDIESLYNRLVIDDEPEDWRDFREQRAWQFESGWPHDFAEAGLAIPVSIRFPCADLPTVRTAIRTAAAVGEVDFPSVGAVEDP